MKHSITRLAVLAGAVALAGAPALLAETHNRASAPIIITFPAIPDGSNYSRAPFPAARPQNDVTPPNGMAFDQNLPPNTPATNPEPVAPPVPEFAILQPKVAPGLEPTGRASVSASAALAAPRMNPVLQTASFDSRADLVDNLRVRERSAETALLDIRRTKGEMSPEGRSQFDTLDAQARDARKALDKSLRAADDANSENWDARRAQLMSDYDAYAATLAQVDAAVGIAPATR